MIYWVSLCFSLNPVNFVLTQVVFYFFVYFGNCYINCLFDCVYYLWWFLIDCPLLSPVLSIGEPAVEVVSLGDGFSLRVVRHLLVCFSYTL